MIRELVLDLADIVLAIAAAIGFLAVGIMILLGEAWNPSLTV